MNTLLTCLDLVVTQHNMRLGEEFNDMMDTYYSIVLRESLTVVCAEGILQVSS